MINVMTSESVVKQLNEAKTIDQRTQLFILHWFYATFASKLWYNLKASRNVKKTTKSAIYKKPFAMFTNKNIDTAHYDWSSD